MDSPRRELQIRENRVKNGLILRILRPIRRRAYFFVESKKSKESKESPRANQVFPRASPRASPRAKNIVRKLDDICEERDDFIGIKNEL